MPWPRKTSTCRSFVTISSGLCRLFAIVVLLHGQNHTSRWTRSMGVDHLGIATGHCVRICVRIPPLIRGVPGFCRPFRCLRAFLLKPSRKNFAVLPLEVRRNFLKCFAESPDVLTGQF